MRASLVISRDPFRPALNLETRELRRRRRIRALMPRTKLPVVCFVNGRPAMRAEWRRRVRDGDHVVFVTLLQDGDTLRIAALIAVIAFAPYAAGALGFQAGTFAYALTSTAISFAGVSLVNHLLPPPKQTPAAAAAALAAPSPTYNLNAQGNSARLGSPIPVLYGRMRIFPDFAALPYLEYAGNEQYLYQLLCVTQGECTIHEIRIGDTPISSFPEITYEIVPPGGTVTKFPSNVVTSTEVSGQEAFTDVALGPFVANSSGTQANAIAIDVVLPRGLYYQNDNGGLDQRSITWRAEYQAIDDNGTPTGGWLILGTETFPGNTTTPQRLSYRYTVPLGRYQVRLTRTSEKSTDTRTGNDLAWASLRAYLPGSQQYGNVTLLAMRMRASNSLSAQSARKVNVIATRKLPTWSVGGWGAPVETRNIAWALADICRNSDYAAGLADARIDIAGLASLAATWNTRSDTFDGVFDSQSTIWEALTQVARVGRAQPFIQSGIVRFVRDEAATIPVAMFTPRNIIKGSFRLSYNLPNEDTADAVEVGYLDSATWKQNTVLATLPTSTATKPAKVTLFGCTSRKQAWREGMYMAASNRYRRRTVSFSTEMEGFIPSLGDLIAIQHDMPRWGYSGELTSWEPFGESMIARFSEVLPQLIGAHSFAFRRRDGTVAGPYLITTAGPNLVQIHGWNAATDPTPDTDGTRERSHYMIGPRESHYINARVLSSKPTSAEQVEIAAVVDSDYAHTADDGEPPTQGAWQLPSDFSVPRVRGLLTRSSPGDVSLALLSWIPASGADSYLIDQSDLGGSSGGSHGSGSWTRCGETSTANFTTRAIYGPRTVFRVAGVGAVVGPWTVAAYGAGSDFFWTEDPNLFWSGDDSRRMWK